MDRAVGTDGAARIEGDGDGGGEGDHDGAEPSDRPGPEGRRQRSLWRELPILVVVALVLALLVKTFLMQAFSIPSESMQNTLQPGDRVLVDKLTPWFGSKPERGDVVVFHDPADWLGGEGARHPDAVQKALGFIGLMPAAGERDLIKRVIGVAGDTVECRGTGPVYVNGKPLDEPYVFAGNTPCSSDDQGGQFDVTVPQGRIWVMGDHRQDSSDSRYHRLDTTHGFVPVGNVVGRAVVVAWPIDRWATLPVPDTFGQPGIRAASAAAPGALGLAGAVPLVLWRRHRRL
ncbi:signal peptidase I [Streptomyces sp. V4-01]|uniref:Signal peptidase I n=1 Tax=Actinacidiphila polyblastidii TaxID=3110430 RepID=A0ABU7PGC0_9ACTN|nr:signal peptidase I [Streptomyces sp. V4-01]